MIKNLKKIVCFAIASAIFWGTCNFTTVKAAELSETTENIIELQEETSGLSVSSYAKILNIGVPEKMTTRDFLCTTATQYQLLDCNEKGYKFEVSAPSLNTGQVVSITLYHTSGIDVSNTVKIKKASQKAVFYLEKTYAHYSLKYSVNSGTIRLKETISSVTPMAGNSFKQATSISSGSGKIDILGYNLESSRNHYYKINVPKEKLVKINFTKEESNSSQDVMYIKIVKSTNTSKVVAEGYLHEGQKNAFIYIRNSNNYRTAPGTYYIIVNKPFKTSGFEYSVTY